MKKTLLPLIALLAFALGGTLRAHERITLGPNGGRLIAIDSPTTPNAEFSVTKDGRFRIGFVDKAGKALPVGERTLSVTAGERSAAKKLSTEAKADAILSEIAPEGKDYHVIMQLREPGAGKAKTFRLHYNLEICGECQKAEWLCSCGVEHSGKNVAVPATPEALWAAIDEESKELTEASAETAYEAVDEVTEALPVLVGALPAKTDAAKKGVAELTAAIQGVRDAFAARTPAEAKPHLEAVQKTLASLKAMKP